MAERTGAFTAALRHAENAMEAAKGVEDEGVLAEVLVRRGGARQTTGDLNGALIDLHEALRIFERLGDQAGLATVFNHIGAIHHYDRNYTRAYDYYKQSMAIRSHTGSTEDLAVLYGNIGSVLEEMGAPDSALAYHRRNLLVRRRIGEPSWIAVCYANLGTCFDKLGQLDSAQYYLEAALGLLRREDDTYRKGHVTCALGLTHLHRREAGPAIQRCTESLELAGQLDNLPLKEQCFHCLYQAYRLQGRNTQALEALESYMTARDSLFGERKAKESVRIELNYAFQRQQIADSLARIEEQRLAEFAYQERLTRERDQKRVFLGGAIGILVLAGGLWSRLRYMRRSRNLFQRERDRSDRLLRNILPVAIAEELKQHGRAQAREVEGVSILFTDFHDFTRMSERMTAQELVAEIDTCYRTFDSIVARYGLEKIKTIGDAYMCAGGLPSPRPHSTRDTVRAALEMRDWLMARADEREGNGLPCFRMRVGIHTGPVVAGIVGDSKFQYDVWGDTVNTAARMESAGAVDDINISEATFILVRQEADLEFSPRGRITVKGKGELAMFFVRRKAP